MKKQTLLLLVLGTFLMSFPLIVRYIFLVPEGIVDFTRGLGVAFVISSLFIQKKLEKKEHS